MKVKRVQVTNPGLLKGIEILQKAWMGLHPSIIAASSRSIGIFSKIPDISQAVNAALYTVSSRITAILVPNNPKECISILKGRTMIIGGSARVNSMNIRRRCIPLNLRRENAKPAGTPRRSERIIVPKEMERLFTVHLNTVKVAKTNLKFSRVGLNSSWGGSLNICILVFKAVDAIQKMGITTKQMTAVMASIRRTSANEMLFLL